MKSLEVKKMFETIATGYDFQNSFLSLRTDTWWRRMMVRNIQCPKGGVVLDVATGTAEMALEIIKQRPDVTVTGMDFSPKMLEVGLRKVRKTGLEKRITLIIGDALIPPFRDSRFDVITISFGIRNINEKDEVLSMVFQLLKPGGQLLIMEFGIPQTPIIGQAYQFYFDRILPRMGDLISRTGYAYTYLAHSVHRFPVKQDFACMMEDAGFREITVKNLTFGVALLFIARKPR